MTNPYRALFAAPGSLGFTVAGLLARLPLPMAGIGIITMLSQLRASYAMAGAVSATFVLTYALLSPQISRLVDRHGQTRILPAATGLSAGGLLLLAACAAWQAPDWTLFGAALLAGCMPSMSAMVRARWSAIYRGQPRLQTAYSLETVFDEVTFIVGPPLSIALSVSWFAPAGLMAAALLLLLGGLSLAALDGSAPARQPLASDAPRPRSVLRLAPVRLLTLLMVAMGVIVGTVDIVSVAFAGQHQQPAAASLVLAAYAVGSCAAGLGFGALTLSAPPHRLLLAGGVATAATALLLPQAGSVLTLAGVVLMAGLAFAPTMIVAMSLIETALPAPRLTEGMTWLLAGLNIGVALGAALAGQVIDGSDAHSGFRVAVAAGLLVLLIALGSQSGLRLAGKPCVRAG